MAVAKMEFFLTFTMTLVYKAHRHTLTAYLDRGKLHCVVFKINSIKLMNSNVLSLSACTMAGTCTCMLNCDITMLRCTRAHSLALVMADHVVHAPLDLCLHLGACHGHQPRWLMALHVP